MRGDNQVLSKLVGELHGKVDLALMELARINMKLFPEEKVKLKLGMLPPLPLKQEEDFSKMEAALDDSRVFEVAVRVQIRFITISLLLCLTNCLTVDENQRTKSGFDFGGWEGEK